MGEPGAFDRHIAVVIFFCGGKGFHGIHSRSLSAGAALSDRLCGDGSFFTLQEIFTGGDTFTCYKTGYGIGSPVVCQPVFSDIGMQVYDSRQECIHHNHIRDSCTIFILVDRKKTPGQKMCCRCFHRNFGHWPFIHTRGSDGSNRRLSDRHMRRRSCFAYYICR